MFAVFKAGSKQYRVAAHDVLKIDKIEAKAGAVVEFDEVLIVGGDSVALGAPTLAGATVTAEVLQHGRGAKIITFKKRRRKNSRRKRGHRQEFTVIRITEILTDGKKPGNKAPPELGRALVAGADESVAAPASQLSETPSGGAAPAEPSEEHRGH